MIGVLLMPDPVVARLTGCEEARAVAHAAEVLGYPDRAATYLCDHVSPTCTDRSHLLLHTDLEETKS